MAPVYRYYACDAIEGDILQELPLAGVAMQTRLGGGTFSASLPMNDQRGDLPEVQRRDLLGYTVPLASTIVATRDGEVMSEWQIVKRTRPLGSGPIALEGVEVVGHMGRRYVDGEVFGTVSSNGTENGVDQFTIARKLVQLGMGGIRVDLGTGLSGIRKYRGEWKQGSKTTEDALAEIAATDDGFDYWIETSNRAEGDLIFNRFLRLAAPRAGRDVSDELTFEYASTGRPTGTVVAFGGLVEDGALFASRTLAVGKDGIMAVADGPRYDAGGRLAPISETAGSFTSISTASALQSHATAMLADAASMYGPPTLSVLADGAPLADGSGYTGPALGDWALGDVVGFQADPSPSFPDGIDRTVRVIGWTLAPVDAGPDVIELEVDWTDKPNATAPRDLVAVLQNARRRLRDLENR